MNKKIIALHLLDGTVILAELIGKDEHYRLKVKTDFQVVSDFWTDILEGYYVEEYIEPTDEKNIYIFE